MSDETKENVKWLFGVFASIFLFVCVSLFNDMRDKVNHTYDFVIKYEDKVKAEGEEMKELKKEVQQLRFTIQSAQYKPISE